MLAQDDGIEETLLASGVLDQARAGTVHVNLATISAAFAQKLGGLHRERGLGYVAAPVLGRPEVAAAGELNVLCAGEPADMERVRPLLDLFAKRVWPFGQEAHRANVVKLACNFALASMIETLGEAGALVNAYGVQPAALFELMTGTLFASPAYKTYSQIIADQRIRPPGSSYRLASRMCAWRSPRAKPSIHHCPLHRCCATTSSKRLRMVTARRTGPPSP